jgi:hypothetical protein
VEGIASRSHGPTFDREEGLASATGEPDSNVAAAIVFECRSQVQRYGRKTAEARLIVYSDILLKSFVVSLLLSTEKTARR